MQGVGGNSVLQLPSVGAAIDGYSCTYTTRGAAAAGTFARAATRAATAGAHVDVKVWRGIGSFFGGLQVLGYTVVCQGSKFSEWVGKHVSDEGEATSPLYLFLDVKRGGASHVGS